MRKTILFATLGYPGSGKTFFARRFAREFGFVHLNSDRLRLEIFPKPQYTADENAVVFRVMDLLCGEFLHCGVSVIYDANSTKRSYRKRLQQIAKKHKSAYLLLWFKTPIRIALQRIRKRSKFKSELMKQYHREIDDSVLFWIEAEEEKPHREPHVIISGTVSYQEQRKSIAKFINRQ